MVLCAGYGSRLGDLTRDVPKPLLPLAGQPLLGYTLRYLSHHQYTDVVVNTHYRGEMIRAFAGTGDAFGVRVRYSHEDELLGTAGGVKRAADHFAGEPDFAVVYGDLLIAQDLTAMREYHRTRGGWVTVLLHERARSNSRVAMDQDGRITDFRERPADPEGSINGRPWVNSGVYMLDPRVLDLVPADGVQDFPRDIFPGLVTAGRLFGFPLSGYRCAIDSEERYREAERAVADGRYPAELTR